MNDNVKYLCEQGVFEKNRVCATCDRFIIHHTEMDIIFCASLDKLLKTNIILAGTVEDVPDK